MRKKLSLPAVHVHLAIALLTSPGRFITSVICFTSCYFPFPEHFVAVHIIRACGFLREGG